MNARWRLAWDHGSAEVQSLGGMLGPLSLRIGNERELEVMHVAPWAGMTRAGSLPGIMRRLRGEWPCVPFGCTELPSGLAQGWSARTPEDNWAHGYAANHHWRCVSATPHRVQLAIDYPPDAAIEHIEREIAVDPDSPAIDISLRIWARRATRMPAGLHPTFRLPLAPQRVRVLLGRHDGVFSYPANPAGALSRLVPDTRSDSLSHLAGIDGPVDLSRLPLGVPAEELLQVKSVAASLDMPPFALHYLDYDAYAGLWWDTEQLPDLMLWVSNGGRIHFPWMSRHLALGAEPVNSLFDLGRVASAPPDHPLADRLGISLSPDRPWQTRYRIAAWPQAPHQP
jgi:hypothetical protein